MNEEKKQMQFIPFHAINEFMRSDFRISILRSTMQALPDLSSKTQSSLNKLTKKYVKVPGFRNSAKAPASVKAVGMVKPFEKEAKLVAEVLSAWVESNPELRTQVFEILTNFEWKLLPAEANRNRLPGFLMDWPEEEDYELIYKVYTEKYPKAEHGIDEVSLMAIWLSMRLPVEKVSKADLSNLPFDLNQPPEEENE
jgi:hypothetical protein